MDKELETKYRRKYYNTVFKQEDTVLDKRQWLIDKGGLNKHGAVIITNYTPAEHSRSGRVVEPIDCDPILYETLEDEWRQWSEWRGKREYAKRKENERYEAEVSTT